MINWLSQWYLGLFGAWLAVTVYDRLCIWWREGEAELVITEVEHDDPVVQRAQPWRRHP
jgi:hypothetical protein